MHKVVERDEPLSGVYLGSIVVPAVDKDCDVMVPVQEYQLLFSQHYEVGVHQFGELGEAEQEHPQAGLSRDHQVPAHAVLPAFGH